MKRYIYIAAAVVVVIVLYLIVHRMMGVKQSDKIKVPVQFGDFEISVTTTGELQAENNDYILAPAGLRNAGIFQIKITDLVDEGTVVDSGDYVGTLDRTELASKLKDLETDVQQGESQYTQAKLDTTLDLTAAREDLVNLKYAMEEAQIVVDQSKYEPPATVREAEIGVDKATRGFNQATADYQLKKQKAVAKVAEIYSALTLKYSKRQELLDLMNQCDVYAPRSGMVIYFKDWDGSKRKVGSTVSVWDRYVASIPDLSKMISTTYVSEVDISKIKVGQKARIKVDALPDKELSGEVLEVSNVGEKMQGTGIKVFDVRIRLQTHDPDVKPSMTTSNEIVSDVIKNVMFLPLEAIQHKDSVTYVFKDAGRKIVKQQVLTGASNDNQVIIEGGLEKDDKVYLSAPDNAENMTIKLLDAKMVSDYNAKKKKELEDRQKPAQQDTLTMQKPDMKKMMNDPKGKQPVNKLTQGGDGSGSGGVQITIKK